MLLILAESDFLCLPEPLRRLLELGCKSLCHADGQIYFSIPVNDTSILLNHLKQVFRLVAGVEYEIRASIPFPRLFYKPA